MADPIIVSVHVPKCAGQSFAHALEHMVSPNALYRDYGDSPFHPNHAVNRDPQYFERFGADTFSHLENKKIVHGHFHPNKYRHLPHARRITVLREPVERLISHYYYWHALPRHQHPLHDYVLDRQLSLEEFAQLPSVRHLYGDVFFKDVDMGRFDIIGSVERMDAFTAAFSALTGMPLTLPAINANPMPSYAPLKNAILGDSKRVHFLHDLLAKDIAFYERWAL